MSTPSMATLAHLPPELYTHILAFVPETVLSSTTLSLTRALPRSPVPQFNLFTHVRLTRKDQLLPFYRRLRAKGDDQVKGYVRHFEMKEWKYDPHVLINTLELLPRLQSLHIWIGYNCAPEHIAEIFSRQALPELETLVLRFHTWTDHANYLPFLKGSYFDSTFEAIARAPPPHLRHLSVVEDVPSADLFDHPDDVSTPISTPADASAPAASVVREPPSVLSALSPALKRNFAPPIVLFSTSCLTALTSSSSLSATLTHLTVRFPQRPILLSLASSRTVQSLDLSTTTVQPPALPDLFGKFPCAKHIILDHCGFFAKEGRDGAAEAVREAGRIAAMWGVGFSRGKEKEAREWFAQRAARAVAEDGNRQADVPASGPTAGLPAHLRPAKKGRRGVAQSTISLRASPTSTPGPSHAPLPLPMPPVRTDKIHIVPPLPALRSFSLGTTDPSLTAVIRAEWQVQFLDGWREGCRRLTEFAKRWRPREGVRVFRVSFSPSDEDDEEELSSLGLVELSESEWEDYTRLASEGRGGEEPVFCSVAACEAPMRRGFGGGRKGKEDGVHAEGCGHEVARAARGE